MGIIIILGVRITGINDAINFTNYIFSTVATAKVFQTRARFGQTRAKRAVTGTAATTGAAVAVAVLAAVLENPGI